MADRSKPHCMPLLPRGRASPTHMCDRGTPRPLEFGVSSCHGLLHSTHRYPRLGAQSYTVCFGSGQLHVYCMAASLLARATDPPYGRWTLAAAPGNYLADTIKARKPFDGH